MTGTTGSVVRSITFVAPQKIAGHLVDLAPGQPGVLGWLADVARDAGEVFGVTPGRPRRSSTPPSRTPRCAHELGHALLRVHASNCNGGGSNGQVAESWPPDQKGLIDSIGLDTNFGSGGGAGPYNILSGNVFDPMSYCASDDDAWMSARGWQEVMSVWSIPGNSGGVLSGCCTPAFQPPGGPTANAVFVRAPRAIPALATSAHGAQVSRTRPIGPGPDTARRVNPKALVPPGRFLQVHALIEPGGRARILSVRPATGFRLATARRSAFHLVVRERPVARATVPVAPIMTHVDGGGAVDFIDAQVPAAGAMSVELMNASRIVAVARRPRQAPLVRVLSPGRAERVGRGATVTVRWRISNPDRSRLLTTIDYAADGRHFTTLQMGAPGSSIHLPATLFSRGAHARVRVRVSDGFNETEAMSARFRATGAQPRIQLQDPTPGTRIAAGAALYMKAAAFDDAGHPLLGKQLQWFVAGKLVGTGEQVSTTKLPPGTSTVEVVARDRTGQHASRTIKVVRMAGAPGR